MHKRKQIPEKKSEEPAVDLYEELSRMNNELVNMHRELAKKNSALDELNKLKNEFLGIAAHDLRNPLGVIMGYSDALLDESEGALSDLQKMMLQEILSSSRFMLGLLNDLLDLSAIESGKVKLELVKSDLVSLVKKNVGLNNVIAHKKNINIGFSKTDDVPEILIDPSKIEQVLNNLISNAIKYSRTGTGINVTISKSTTEIIVSVADQGQGVPKEEVNNLFKPFQKISVKSTSGEKSTGLGLSIVSNLVRAHNGKIWVESEVGKGSTFYFSLPCGN